VIEIPEWPYFLGLPEASGVIRSSPEDFLVEEIARVQPLGEGTHLWLWVQKREANTDWVAGELARVTGCARRDVGYAGLKDRHAVTQQWFSLPASETTYETINKAEIEGVSILESSLHTRKLKRGTLNGNRFELTIRNFTGDSAQTEQRLQQIQATGVPNYFGPQRFGHGGRNVDRGFSLLSSKARLPRNKKSIYLSAIRSFLFNLVLAERVQKGQWNHMLDGDLAMLDGTQSIFPCELPDLEIEDRCSRLDIHPSGPMPGEKGSQPGSDALELEQAILQNWAQLTGVLQSHRVQASRRSLRLYPAALEWTFGDDILNLKFTLPPGTYATTVLREILVVGNAE
jgi:tRNA pseudouridine13 synthase